MRDQVVDGKLRHGTTGFHGAAGMVRVKNDVGQGGQRWIRVRFVQKDVQPGGAEFARGKAVDQRRLVHDAAARDVDQRAFRPKVRQNIAAYQPFGLRPARHHDHKDVAPVGKRGGIGEIAMAHVLLAPRAITDLQLHRGQPRRDFLADGANVVCTDTSEAQLIDELGEPEDHDGRLRRFAGDMSKKLCVANLLSTALDAFERVDILVNANRHVAASDPLAGDEDVVEETLRKNVLAALKLSQAVARRMITQAGDNTETEAGSIINLSSIAAQRSRPELMAYSIASAAQDQATRSLALALAPHRIRVNAVAFGSVMSAHLQSALKDHSDWRRMITEGTPLGRIAPAQDVAEAVQFLASENAAFITGQILTVDGGRTLLDPVPVPAH